MLHRKVESFADMVALVTPPPQPTREGWNANQVRRPDLHLHNILLADLLLLEHL